MSLTAFVFPGQGSQKVGMGAELLQERPEVFDRYLALADAASGLPVRQRCLEGPTEELVRTDVAQPALFALSLALFELAGEAGLTPDFVAGHSLGEYTAAAASGAISVEDGTALVAQRGRLMADIQSQHPGAMAAVIGLPIEQLQELCDEASAVGLVAPANLNTPTQIVVSGEEAAVLDLIERAQAAGAKRALRLQVGAAFHSALMKPVQTQLADAMQDCTWSEPHTPLVGNASGKLLRTSEEIRAALIEQIASPVLWVQCVQTLVGAGCSTFFELGSGRVLSGLVRQIDADVQTFAADSPAKLQEFAERPSV
jgi:[acyl-carrier-protein] S-malonyltransferase